MQAVKDHLTIGDGSAEVTIILRTSGHDLYPSIELELGGAANHRAHIMSCGSCLQRRRITRRARRADDKNFHDESPISKRLPFIAEALATSQKPFSFVIFPSGKVSRALMKHKRHALAPASRSPR